MNRPTIALCCILKNELRNLPRLLASVEGCFDEIHLTDTGSTDGSIEWIENERKKNPKIHLHHFTWVDDFSAARNASFEPATTDYVMWLDLDDVLESAKSFIEWRDTTLKLADFWLATYHYASTPEGKSLCSFARERVVKRAMGFRWKYFVHEGLMPEAIGKKPVTMQYAVPWSVRHMRDAEDMKADKSRNLRIFESRKGTLDPRMRYYYGKELFESGKALDAFPELVNAIASEGLELHDRVMGVQYAMMAAMQLNQYDRALQLAHQGLALSPQRAEFFVGIGDCHLKSGRVADAVPYYEAATRCAYGGQSPIQGPIFQHEDAYRQYPLNQLARIYANGGDIAKAEKYVIESARFGASGETASLLKEIEEVKRRVGAPDRERKQTDDIVISCPPQTLYEWDPEVYREKGIGGSETAAVEMARHLHDLTGRRVIVFNPREKARSFYEEHGKQVAVEYRPGRDLPEYFRDYRPALHIAWRHGMKLSDDPMYVWCHDLGFMGLENHSAYTKVMALSEFHRGYIKSFFGIPEEKIMVTANGIEPERFKLTANRVKEPGKVIWSSSPDRGLDRAILVMDEVVKHVPDAKLHVYYGFENMKKMGMQAEVDKLEAMMASRPHVVYHGNLKQSELTREMGTACVWLYPTNFLETYCITAVEALCSGVYPVVRRWGALPDTLSRAEKAGMATLLDAAGETPEEIDAYARAVIAAFAGNAWERVQVDPHDYSWKRVAESWVQIFKLAEDECLAPQPIASLSS